MRAALRMRVAHGLLWDTVRTAWGWGNGWQESNGFDEGFNVALFQQLALLLSPLCSFGCSVSKDGIGHLPDVLLGMPEIHNLHSGGKMFSDHIPNPGGSIPQDDDLLRMSQTTLLSQRVEPGSKRLNLATPSHIRAFCLPYRQTPQVPILNAFSPALLQRPPQLSPRDTHLPSRLRSLSTMGTLPRRNLAMTPSISTYILLSVASGGKLTGSS